MKRRDDGGGGRDEGTSESYGKGRWRRQKRNEQRLGGKGLSLEAFANAKSRPSGYNPALIKKQREFYRNAKYVTKYKKTQKQQNLTSDHMPTTSDDKDADEIEKLHMQRKPKKRSLRSLREEYEKKHAEDEKARIEREAIIQAKKKERAKAEAKRKVQREKMFKKTKSGQPVMKYRIEQLLEGLIESSQK
ncbi:uncharacterized protein LOC135587168 [Musa acuminata AAA Group]|uniref:uncharacterized protein LOC135587168 n=1 Tax=Musa acuminata AAA Group TaxID=214697 RepID=UPI0031D1453C